MPGSRTTKPTARRRRRGWIIAAAAAVVVLLAVAYQVTRTVAEGRLAARLQCAAGLSAGPQVTLHGFPFTDDMEVTARDVHRGGITLGEVHARLRGVSRERIGYADIEARVGFAALPQQLAGRPVAYRESGGLLAVDTTLRGLPVTLLARPALDGRTLSIEPQEVEALGLRRSADRLQDRGIRRELPELPAGLEYRSVATNPAGLTVALAGTDIRLPKGGHGGGACKAAK